MVHSFNGITFDPLERTLSRGGVTAALFPKTRDLLLVLLRNPNRLLTRIELMDLLWPNVHVVDESLTYQVSELRKALGDQSHLLRTIPREGYMWMGEGIAAEEQAAAATPAAVCDSGAAAAAPAPEAAPPVETRRTKKRLVIGSASVAVLAVIALIAFGLHRHRGNLGDGRGWVESYKDDFDRAGIGPALSVTAGEWTVKGGGLVGEGFGHTTVDLVERFPGNVRLDMDATVLPGSGKREIAMFIRRDHETEPAGYYLAVGGDNEVVEVDRHGVEVVSAACPMLEAGRKYHVALARIGERLELSIDGTILLRYTDLVPLNPAEYSILRIGTYDGTIRIDNLRVSRERVPDVLGPTAPGDRLFEMGQYDAARAEYERVASDQAGKPVGGEAEFKAGLCLLRAGMIQEAMGTFRRVESSAAGKPYVTAAQMALANALAESGDPDGAFDLLAGLEGRLTAAEDRYQLASLIEGVAPRFVLAGRPDRCMDVRRFVIDRFPDQTVLVERSAYLLAKAETDPRRLLTALEDYLRTYKRIGKPRYHCQEYLALVQFLNREFAGALETRRMTEQEFADVNARFSVRAMYEQALVLDCIGRGQEAAAVIERMKQRRNGDPDAYVAEWEFFSKWMAGDPLAAAAVLERSLAAPRRTERERAFDRIFLAILYWDAGDTVRAEESMRTQLVSAIAGPREIARLFLGTSSVELFVSNMQTAHDERYYFAGEYERLRGRVPEAIASFARCLEYVEDISPISCRAFLYTMEPERAH